MSSTFHFELANDDLIFHTLYVNGFQSCSNIDGLEIKVIIKMSPALINVKYCNRSQGL